MKTQILRVKLEHTFVTQMTMPIAKVILRFARVQLGRLKHILFEFEHLIILNNALVIVIVDANVGHPIGARWLEGFCFHKK